MLTVDLVSNIENLARLLWQRKSKKLSNIVMFSLACCLTNPLPPVTGLATVQGPWLDQAFSKSLSQKYHCQISVTNVKITSWSQVHFDSLKVSTQEKKLLASVASGEIHLKNWGIRKGRIFEIEACLKDVSFTAAFYKNSPSYEPWGRFLDGPLRVKDLKINVLKNNRTTTLDILDCKSKYVKLDGGMTLDRKGVVKDNIRTSFTPFMILHAIF